MYSMYVLHLILARFYNHCIWFCVTVIPTLISHVNQPWQPSPCTQGQIFAAVVLLTEDAAGPLEDCTNDFQNFTGNMMQCKRVVRSGLRLIFLTSKRDFVNYDYEVVHDVDARVCRARVAAGMAYAELPAQSKHRQRNNSKCF